MNDASLVGLGEGFAGFLGEEEGFSEGEAVGS